jgi:hypothetical protein
MLILCDFYLLAMQMVHRLKKKATTDTLVILKSTYYMTLKTQEELSA